VLSAAAAPASGASALAVVGAGLFGVVIGWFAYFVNRHRGDDVRLSDVAGFLGAIGGGAVLALFPSGTDLFGAYGIGLAVGFFAYFAVLVVLVARSPGWTAEWFLDGRRPTLPRTQQAGDGSHPLGPTASSATDSTGIR
jgi:hypothetical protein